MVLAGGYAISAHGLLDRPSRDLDFATGSPLPLGEIADRLAQVFREHGLSAAITSSAPRTARMEVSDGPLTCEVDLLKEALGPAATLEIGPVLSLDDAVGLKMRALHNRALHRDFMDVHAAYLAGYSWRDLERLGRRHHPEMTVEVVADRLGSVGLRDDRTFVSLGLDATGIEALRSWALAWSDDINKRLTSNDQEAAPPGGDIDWDRYLDE